MVFVLIGVVGGLHDEGAVPLIRQNVTTTFPFDYLCMYEAINPVVHADWFPDFRTRCPNRVDRLVDASRHPRTDPRDPFPFHTPTPLALITLLHPQTDTVTGTGSVPACLDQEVRS